MKRLRFVLTPGHGMRYSYYVKSLTICNMWQLIREKGMILHKTYILLSKNTISVIDASKFDIDELIC